MTSWRYQHHLGRYVPWRTPQPEWSAFREASFGVAALRLVNRTHSYYNWSRSACEAPDAPAHIEFNATCVAWGPTGQPDNAALAAVASDVAWVVRPDTRDPQRNGCVPPVGGWRAAPPTRTPPSSSSSSSSSTLPPPPPLPPPLPEVARSSWERAVAALVLVAALLLPSPLACLVRSAREGVFCEKRLIEPLLAAASDGGRQGASSGTSFSLARTRSALGLL